MGMKTIELLPRQNVIIFNGRKYRLSFPFIQLYFIRGLGEYISNIFITCSKRPTAKNLDEEVYQFKFFNIWSTSDKTKICTGDVAMGTDLTFDERCQEFANTFFTSTTFNEDLLNAERVKPEEWEQKSIGNPLAGIQRIKSKPFKRSKGEYIEWLSNQY